MSELNLTAITAALTEAGVEVYRVVGAEVQIAERIRLHMMDSGVRVEVGARPRVVFKARSQRSDYPHMSADELIALVRKALGSRAQQQGFQEVESVSRELRDPSREDQVLDVWHEITYAKQSDSDTALVDDVKWALALEKYVAE